MRYSQTAKHFGIITYSLSPTAGNLEPLTVTEPPGNMGTICCARLHIEINKRHWARFHTVLILLPVQVSGDHPAEIKPHLRYRWLCSDQQIYTQEVQEAHVI